MPVGIVHNGYRFYYHWFEGRRWFTLDSPDGPELEEVPPDAFVVMASDEQDDEYNTFINFYPLGIFERIEDANTFAAAVKEQYGEIEIHGAVYNPSQGWYRHSDNWYRVKEG